MNIPKKEQDSKKSSSLSWRLAFSQTGQVFSSYLKVDILIVLLVFIGLVFWSEVKANSTHKEYLLNPEKSIVQLLERDKQLSIRQTSQGEGLRSPFSFKSERYFPEGTYRKMGLKSPKTDFGKDFKPSMDFPVYKIYYTAQDNNFWEITVYWEISFLFVVVGLTFLLVYQLLSIPFIVVKSRNRIRIALQPIYELTAAAQNISSGSKDFAVPLSGTIDALNDISAVHFDRRIPISHEREELQGLAQAINDMLDRLDASYQAQLRFVSDASHELRTPIAIIQGYAGLLSRWGKDDPIALQESVDAIESEAISMQKLVEQLLFLARSDNQSLQVQKEPLNVSELLLEVLRETEMINKTHEIVENIAPNIHLVGDPQLIKQATRILVDNSIKYTPDNGRITIDLEETSEDVLIHVSDTGIGVPPDELEFLFKRFWRADESRTRKTGGTGLGLAIAHWIVESHGGYISVVSRVDVGSKFTITLPKNSINGSFSIPIETES